MSKTKEEAYPGMSRAEMNKKIRKTGIDRRKMNKAGYYEGMPGVHLDEYGNREMITIVITPEGEAKAYLKAHNKHIKIAVEDLCTHNGMMRAVFSAAFTDYMYKHKSIFNFLWRIRYYLFKWWRLRQRKKAAKKLDPSQLSTSNQQTK